jgi:hypothetical protein
VLDDDAEQAASKPYVNLSHLSDDDDDDDDAEQAASKPYVNLSHLSDDDDDDDAEQAASKPYVNLSHLSDDDDDDDDAEQVPRPRVAVDAAPAAVLGGAPGSTDISIAERGDGREPRRGAGLRRGARGGGGGGGGESVLRVHWVAVPKVLRARRVNRRRPRRACGSSARRGARAPTHGTTLAGCRCASRGMSPCIEAPWFVLPPRWQAVWIHAPQSGQTETRSRIGYQD